MPVEQAVAAIEESGAPMVSIAGGEPLLHPEIHLIAAELIRRRKFVYCAPTRCSWSASCTFSNPLPISPSRCTSTGLRERHDESVCRRVCSTSGGGDARAQRAGFRVTTNTTFFTHDTAENVRAVLDFLNDELEVDEMMISPGYAYEKAPDQEHFLPVEQTRKLFREAFKGGRRKRWRLNHSPLFLDFLEGKVDFQCTAWEYRATEYSAGSGPAI